MRLASKKKEDDYLTQGSRFNVVEEFLYALKRCNASKIFVNTVVYSLCLSFCIYIYINILFSFYFIFLGGEGVFPC